MGNRQVLAGVRAGSSQVKGGDCGSGVVSENSLICCCRVKLLAGIAIRINLAFLQIPFNISLKRYP